MRGFFYYNVFVSYIYNKKITVVWIRFNQYLTFILDEIYPVRKIGTEHRTF